LPCAKEQLDTLLPHLCTFRDIYPREFITVYAPKSIANEALLKDAEILPYNREDEVLRRDYRFKLIFNFTSCEKIKPHFSKLSALKVITLKELQRRARQEAPLSQILKKTLLTDAS